MINLKARDLQLFKEMSGEEIGTYLLTNYSALQLASALVEFIEHYDPENQRAITVTADEYDRICSMFRVQGSSPRGRKPKIRAIIDPEDE